MLPAYADDTSYKLKDAMAVWVEWKNRPDTSLGYGRSTGFASGGSAIESWDDFERKVDKNMAINVQALYEGLNTSQQVAIDHFYLAAVWKSNRTNIEDDLADAMQLIEIGLRRRGLI
jgi:hypothetical protein